MMALSMDFATTRSVCILQDAARFMVGILQDKAEPQFFIRVQLFGADVQVVKTDKEELGRLFNFEAVCISRREQEEMAGLVAEAGIVDELLTFALHNVYQLKEGMAVHGARAPVQYFFQHDLEGLV
jgi:hypothetical protein